VEERANLATIGVDDAEYFFRRTHRDAEHRANLQLFHTVTLYLLRDVVEQDRCAFLDSALNNGSADANRLSGSGDAVPGESWLQGIWIFADQDGDAFRGHNFQHGSHELPHEGFRAADAAQACGNREQCSVVACESLAREARGKQGFFAERRIAGDVRLQV